MSTRVPATSIVIIGINIKRDVNVVPSRQRYVELFELGSESWPFFGSQAQLNIRHSCSKGSV